MQTLEQGEALLGGQHSQIDHIAAPKQRLVVELVAMHIDRAAIGLLSDGQQRRRICRGRGDTEPQCGRLAGPTGVAEDIEHGLTHHVAADLGRGRGHRHVGQCQHATQWQQPHGNPDETKQLHDARA
ncbi:hypothetical protein D3C78_1361270 [compost metagenome]